MVTKANQHNSEQNQSSHRRFWYKLTSIKIAFHNLPIHTIAQPLTVQVTRKHGENSS